MTTSDEEKIRFLTKNAADTIPHSGRTLLDHLIGTHDLLETWPRREAVCDAGLFHSIYGTEHLPKVTVAPSMRFLVRKLIGDEAEKLAWIFGALQRESFDQNIPRRSGYSVLDRTNGKTIPLT